jgi:hypothetical protein
MGRAAPNMIRIMALIAVLGLAQGCKEREQLEKEAPALANADLKKERIAIAGVVSDAPTVGDSTASRESWAVLIGDRLGRERFGKLPIVAVGELRAVLGREDHNLMLDRYRELGSCDDAVLAELHSIFEGRARFVVFGNILEDRIEQSQSESEIVDEKTKKVTSRTRTMKTTRVTTVRVRFYDLTDQQLAWDHLTVGESFNSKDHDMTDFLEHQSKEGFLAGLLTSIANSAIKPDPKYPAAPDLQATLSSAFDNVGAFLKPGKKK